MKHEISLDNVSLALTEYKDGDLLALMDLSEMIETFAREHAKKPAETKLCAIVVTHLNRRLKDGAKIRRDFIAQALDLVRRLLLSNEGPDDETQGRISQWLAQFSAQIDELRKNDAPRSPDEPEVDHANAAGGGAPGESSPNAKKAAPAPKIESGALGDLHRQEVFGVFLADASERMSRAQELVLSLEKDANQDEACQELFRVFHTIKGECGFFKLASMGELAHNFENLLDLVRQHSIVIESSLIDLLLKGIDRFRDLIAGLVARDVTLFNNIELDDLLAEIDAFSVPVRPRIGDQLVEQGLISEAERVTILEKQKESSYTRKFGEIASSKGLVSEKEIAAAMSVKPPEPKSPTDGKADAKQDGEAQKHRTAVDQFIKVQASQINYLVDMVGELIIAEGQVSPQEPALVNLRKITKQIQAAAFRLRTTKLNNLMISMNRAVRDISHTLNKEIVFESSGEELEVDRNLVEGLSEPLIHMIRNSAHHGIEAAEQRKALGKLNGGTIRLDAERKGNSIAITVGDDGKGLNRDAILAKAIEKGLIDADKASGASDKQIYDFIFNPGFSTAQEVGLISGRGVGMDIVKNFVTSHRGRVDIETEAGKGTSIRLQFPISTAIIDGMIVRIGKVMLIIPVSNVIESLSLKGESRHSVAGKTKVLNLRGEVLPMISLPAYFGVECVSEEMGIVVEDVYQKRYVFVVEQIVGKREVVIKPLGSRFSRIRSITSGTVLSGGAIAYILDCDFIINDTGDK